MKLKSNCPEFYNDISESIRAFLEVPNIELSENDYDISVMEYELNGQIKATTEYKGEIGEYSEPMEAFDRISKKRLKKHVAKLYL